jgi:hypothetical protein
VTQLDLAFSLAAYRKKWDSQQHMTIAPRELAVSPDLQGMRASSSLFVLAAFSGNEV